MNIDYKNLTIEEINNQTNRVINEQKELYDSLIMKPATWQSFIAPIVEFDKSALPILTMAHFHPDEKIRKSCSENETRLKQFQIEQFMRRDMFNKFNECCNENLSDEQRKYIEDTMLEYKLYGLHLDDDKLNKIKDIKTLRKIRQ